MAADAAAGPREAFLRFVPYPRRLPPEPTCKRTVFDVKIRAVDINSPDFFSGAVQHHSRLWGLFLVGGV